MKSTQLPEYAENTTLIVPGCSNSLTDNFALDWIISTLHLERVAVLDSQAVTPMVQPGVFGCAQITTAIELYSSPTSSVSVLQIRSSVVAKQTLAEELLKFGQRFAKIFVVGAASGFMLSGDALEETSRFRTIGDRPETKDYIPISAEEVFQGGLLKRLATGASKVPVICILVLTSGQGFAETCLLSEGLALRVLKLMQVSHGNLVEPKSIRSLLAAPAMTPELERIL